MIDSRDPETRRGIRTWVQIIVQFSLIFFAFLLMKELKDPTSIEHVCMLALGIVAIDNVGYVMENGMRAFKLSANASGVSLSAEADKHTDNKEPAAESKPEEPKK
jgi:hypothetical protein